MILQKRKSEKFKTNLWYDSVVSYDADMTSVNRDVENLFVSSSDHRIFLWNLYEKYFRSQKFAFYGETFSPRPKKKREREREIERESWNNYLFVQEDLFFDEVSYAVKPPNSGHPK